MMRSRSELRSNLTDEQFLDLLAEIERMSQKEFEAFAADPTNAHLIREYESYRRSFALRVVLPLLAILAACILAGGLLSR